MPKKYIRKTLQLGLEFNQYVITHPRFWKKIPNKANLIITEKDDEVFSEHVRAEARTGRSWRKLLEARKEGSRWTIKPLVEVK